MFVIIGVMLIINMLFINFFQNKIDQHSKALAIAHRSQSLIEYLSNTSKKIFRQNEFDIKEDLLLTSSKINKNIETLINGGTLSGSNLIFLPINTNIKSQAESIRKNWREAISALNLIHSEPIKVDSIIIQNASKTELVDSTYQEVSYQIERIILVPNPVVRQSLDQFNNYKKLLFSQIDDLTTSIITDFETQKSNFTTALWVIMIINLVIVGLFLFLMVNAVILPLSKIGYLTGKVADGEVVDFKYKKEDEIGKIVTSVKSLGNHLRQASDFVHHIGEGNLEVTLEGLNEEKDKEGSLANALISMQDKLKLVSEEDTARNWATIGMAKFAEILRAHNTDLKSLGDAILAELTDYTDSNIGCIYVPDESNDKEVLKLIAFYAYDTKKHFNESVAFGEGLIGQTFIEKKTTYLLEVPEDYTHIKSGVGTSSPKSILVVPLKVNKDVFGVLEIASFKEFTDHQIEFIERVGETIAGTIHNVKNTEQTKKLLEDSQQLTEQMRAQEEEMRQNMEELSATQEEFTRKEMQTSSIIDAFDSAVATVEFDSDGIISNVNTLFTKLSGYAKSALIGMDIASIVDSSDQKNISESIQEVFRSTSTLTQTLIIRALNGEDRLTLIAHINHLQSGDAIMVCTQSESSNEVKSHSITEIEEELTQNLNMLEVTQKSFDEKVELLTTALVYLEIGPQGNVIAFNSKLNSLLTDENMEIVGSNYVDILSHFILDTNAIQNTIDVHQQYQGIVSINESDNENIMLLIEQLNNKK
jgi:PAS domain S-box-containing protein